MQGTISLASEPGEGSAFTVSLPGVEVATGEDAEMELSLSFRPDDIRFEPAKILIADDIEYNRDVFAAYLDLANLTHCFAADGEQALEQVKSQKTGPDRNGL